MEETITFTYILSSLLCIMKYEITETIYILNVPPLVQIALN